MDKRDKKKSYSDLEAIVTSSSAADRQSYWNAKFAVPSTPIPVPQATGANEEKASHDAKAIFDASPVDTLAPAPPAYFLVDSKGQTQALYTAPTNTPSDASSTMDFKGGIAVAAAPSSGGWWSSLGEGKRICGMRKNVFLAVTAGVCALVLGLLITILVVTHPKGHDGGRDKSGSNEPIFATESLLDKGDTGPFLVATNIAAMNWTVGGEAYTGVFYQSSATSGAGLMVAIKTERTQEWNTVNISAAVTGKVLDVLPGTPLAAASNNGLWNLYYLTTGMTIEELYSTDPMTIWQQGEFAAKLGHPQVMASSGLGAMWQLCDDCDNALFVMWQNAQSGSLVYANMTNLTWGSSPVVISNSATPGTPAAVSAFTDTGKSKGSDHNAIRYYWTQGSSLQETLKGPLGGGNLVAGNNSECTSSTSTWERTSELIPYADEPIANNLSSNPPPTLASLTYGTDQTGWNNNLLAWVDPFKGQLQAANFRNGGGWTVKVPTLDGSPQGLVDGGFSTVAMTQAMRIYVFSPVKGEIHEYSTNSSNVLEWTWQTTVDT
ncbi:hypothetical protein N0V93_010225 [Gnomoniopsis smithogilvyi]|uniref:Fucose-specific lectin n=1 Tax=Gnomoniopsis smithogilvyi TaxID=1191159 RepID=A0A9W9CS81_9PEZI|nr:hypothetical protein N0V93_010225 [Gnomoniopsis smithogilvyi]